MFPIADKVLDAVLLVGCAFQEITLHIGYDSFLLVGAVIGSVAAIEPFHLREPVVLVKQMEEAVTETDIEDEGNNEKNIDPPGN